MPNAYSEQKFLSTHIWLLCDDQNNGGINKERQGRGRIGRASIRRKFSCRSSRDEGRLRESERLREILYKLAYKQLAPGEWKKLAQHWAFTDDQIKAIEHQYNGPSSYKEHGFRMLLIWAYGLGPEVNPIKEIYESLTAIGKRPLAGINSTKFHPKYGIISKCLYQLLEKNNVFIFPMTLTSKEQTEYTNQPSISSRHILVYFYPSEMDPSVALCTSNNRIHLSFCASNISRHPDLCEGKKILHFFSMV
ncbi:hypothetical protein WA026_005687 [Henosepilachna vigintioctopunctata]|uniref:Death domain-containing protein n=1 Tax=Henosepilachna vigintioctopunctata TaxID=420089 RepID=A0AAW1U1N8_9CUCU